MSIATHAKELGDLAHSVKTLTLDNPTRDSLTAAWKEWVEEAGVDVSRRTVRIVQYTRTDAETKLIHL